MKGEEEILELLNDVRELNSATPEGLIRDSDTILADILDEQDYKFSGISEDIFQIYINSKDKASVCQMFYEFTGMEFEEYLEKCINEITR